MPIATDNKRKALGRGLESLLPTKKPSTIGSIQAAAAPSPQDGTAELDITLIDANPYQTRAAYDEAALAELTASIEASGVIQPIIVRPHGDGRFHVIAGERRWMACKRLGKASIAAVIRHVSPEKAMEMTIVENLQREDLNPMEQARAYERLGREFSLTQEEMARRTGKERASVANFLRLLKLPELVQQKVAAGELSFGHAKVLLMLDSQEGIAKAAQKVAQLSMSVRQTEKYVHGILHPEDKPAVSKPGRTADPNVRDAERTLQSKLGVKVQIDDRGGRGKITLEYASLEDFDRLLEALG